MTNYSVRAIDFYLPPDPYNYKAFPFNYEQTLSSLYPISDVILTEGRAYIMVLQMKFH